MEIVNSELVEPVDDFYHGPRDVWVTLNWEFGLGATDWSLDVLPLFSKVPKMTGVRLYFYLDPNLGDPEYSCEGYSVNLFIGSLYEGSPAFTGPFTYTCDLSLYDDFCYYSASSIFSLTAFPQMMHLASTTPFSMS